MSALLYSSPRSSPAPADAHLQQHMARQRHHVSFGQAQQQGQTTAAGQHSSTSSLFAQPAPFPSSSSASTCTSAFGFGFASTSTPLPSTSYGFGQQAQSAAYRSPFAANAAAAAAAGPPASSSNVASPNRRRRRRSDSPSNDREMEDNDDNGDSTNADPLHAFSGAGGKRIRREIRPIKSMHALAGSSSAAQTGSASSASSTNEVDIGKALTSLSKPALLSVLTALLTQQPSLKPAVLALLPPPSLETFTMSLHASEKKVLDALPLGGRGLRDEYVWSRVRAPLEEFIAEARLALSQFCPSSSTALAVSPLGETDTQYQQHPATTFAFLYTLTLSIRKLEATLPRAPLPFGATMRATASTSASSSSIAAPSINNPSSLNQNDPLVCFLPLLFNQWHVLVTKLAGLLQHGHVMSAEMVRTWFKQLDALVDLPASSSSSMTGTLQIVQEPASVGRKASEAVRERFVKELGWLIGLRVQNTVGAAMDSQMTQDAEDIDEEL